MGSGGDKTRTILGRKKLPDKLDIMILGLGRENSKPTPRSLAGVALREMGKGKWLSRGEDEQALAWGLVMKGAHPRNPVLGAVDRQHSTLQTVDPGRRPKSGPKKKKMTWSVWMSLVASQMYYSSKFYPHVNLTLVKERLIIIFSLF